MLAVVIPYYNIVFFEKTLQSLAAQKNQNFNVYIGDDDSKDDPSEILKKYQSLLNIQYTKFQNNLGSKSLVKQWERCIALVKNEEWIMILGDDDVLSENCISEFYNNKSKFESSNCNLIRFASQYITQNGDLLKGYKPYYHPVIEKSTQSFYRNIIGKSRSSLSEHIFRKADYEKFSFVDYPLAWHSDDRAWLEFSSFNTIYTLNEAMVSIRVTNHSISGKIDNFQLKTDAGYSFYKYLVYEVLHHFTNKQKATILLAFGVLAKNKKQLDFKHSSSISYKLLKTGNLISFAKFLRRVYIVKVLNK